MPIPKLISDHLKRQPEAVLRFVLSQQPEKLPPFALRRLFLACQHRGLLAFAVELLSLLLSRRAPHVRDFHLTVVLSICHKQRQRAEAERVFSASVPAAYLPPPPFNASPLPPNSFTLLPGIDCYNLLLQMLMQEGDAVILALPRPAYIAQLRRAYAAALSLADWLRSSPLFPSSPPTSPLPVPLAFNSFTYSHLTSLYGRCWLYTGLAAVVERIAVQQLQPTVPVCGSVMQAMHEAQHWEAVLLWFAQAQDAEPTEPRGRRITSAAYYLAIHAAHQLGRYEEVASYHRLMQAKQVQLDNRIAYEQLVTAYRYLGQQDVAQQLQQEAEGKGLKLHIKSEAEHRASLQRQQQQQQQEESRAQALAFAALFAKHLANLPHQPDAVMTALRSEASTLSRAQLNSFFHTCVEHSLLEPATELLSALVQSQSPHIGVQHLISVLAVCLKQRQWDEGVRAFSSSVAAAYLPPADCLSPSAVSSSGSLVPDMSCYNFLLQLLMKQAGHATRSASLTMEQLRAAHAAPLSQAAWLMSSPLFPVSPSSPPSPSPSPLAFDCFTYSLLVSLSARCRMDASLSEVLERLQAQQLQANTVLCCSLSHAQHQAGRYEQTLHWFSQALAAEAAAPRGDPPVDSKSCSIAVHAAVKLGLHIDAVRAHRYMQRRGMQLTDTNTYEKLIIAYTQLGNTSRAQQLQREALRKGLTLREEYTNLALDGQQQLSSRDRQRQPQARGAERAGEKRRSSDRRRQVSGLYAT